MLLGQIQPGRVSRRPLSGSNDCSEIIGTVAASSGDREIAKRETSDSEGSQLSSGISCLSLLAAQEVNGEP